MSSHKARKHAARILGEKHRAWFGAHRPARSTVCALSFYILLTIVATFPFALHPATTIVGPTGGDVAASIAKYDAVVLQHADPFTTLHYTEVSSPGGVPGNIGVDRVSFLSVLYMWVASNVVGPIAAHSLESFAGYLLTAAIAFFFVKRVTRSAAAGFLAGLIFGFSPHMYSIARAEAAYTDMWMFMLPLWAFWELLSRGVTRFRVALAAMSVVPAIFWTPYYMQYVLLVGGSCLAVAIGYWCRCRYPWTKIARVSAVILGVWAISMAAFWFIGTTSPSTHIPVRTTQEAYQQAAHPLMYALPGAYSLWGKPVNEWLSAHVPQAPGTNLYVGISTLTLAIIGGYYYLVHTRKRHLVFGEQGIRLALYLATAATLVCFAFSLPPRVHIMGLNLPTPNQLVITVVPALRAGQRLVMPIMGMLAVLAGIGFYRICKEMRPPIRGLVAVGIVLIVGIDLWSLPPDSATTVPVYTSMIALSKQPRALTAQYQSSSVLGPPGPFPCILQLQHEQPLINDCVLGRPENDVNRAPDALAALNAMPVCDQLTELKKWGVRYIIADRENYTVVHCLYILRSAHHTVAADKTYLVVDISR